MTTTTRGRVRPKEKAGQNVWVADFTDPLTGKRRQLEHPTEAAAWQTIEHAHQCAPEAPTASPVSSSKGYTLAEARKLSMAVRWAGKACERNAAGVTQMVVNYFGPDAPITSINATAWEEFRQFLKRKGNKPASINWKQSAFSAMREDALLYGHVKDLPQLPPCLPLDNTRDRVFSPQEQAGFYAYFKEVGHQPVADLFVFLVQTGCRAGEALALTGRDVHVDYNDLGDSWVLFRKTKNKTKRTTPLTTLAVKAIGPYLPAKPTDLVWSYTYKQVEYLFRRAKGHLGLAADTELTIHCTRHTCASEQARRGVNLVQIMSWGGWKSLRAVQRYAHIDLASLRSVRDLME